MSAKTGKGEKREREREKMREQYRMFHKNQTTYFGTISEPFWNNFRVGLQFIKRIGKAVQFFFF